MNDLDAKAIVSGTVFHLQPIALGPDAIAVVRLIDVSEATAPATVLAEEIIPFAGRQVPIPFTLAYAPAQIDERHEYAVSAQIEERGELRWVTTRRFAVITRGNPTAGLAIRVDPAP